MYYFFINPKSRSGSGLRIWNRLKAVLFSENVDYREYILSRPGEAERLSREITSADPSATIVAVGGDGTVDEIVNGMENVSSVTLAVIPTGSANDFCRGLHITASPETALLRVLHPSVVKRVDVGVLTDGRKMRRFIVSAGTGFDAEVCYRSSKSRFKPLLNRYGLGKMVYTAVAVKSLLNMQRPRLKIRIDRKDTKDIKNVYFAAFMNLPYEGGGYNFTPAADPSDGRLDLCAAYDMPRLKALCGMPLALTGKHTGMSGIEISSGSIIEVRSSEPLCVHCDGEYFGYADRLRVRTLGVQLKVIVG
ncbi:MAG: diacylglycerol kinase family lipid kinase [Lachnospiraceae bacterium]|nr:diacylglycerol kinase family lipid kinase [Lachnospiraceae bacterium]